MTGYGKLRVREFSAYCREIGGGNPWCGHDDVRCPGCAEVVTEIGRTYNRPDVGAYTSITQNFGDVEGSYSPIRYDLSPGWQRNFCRRARLAWFLIGRYMQDFELERYLIK